jgi:hypothetical protein
MTEEAAETMEWHGPAGDRTHRGRDYVERLQGSVGTFDDYQIEVVREVGDGGTVMVELVQRFRSDGNHHVLPEVMVFDVDPASGASPGSPFTSGAPTRSPERSENAMKELEVIDRANRNGVFGQTPRLRRHLVGGYTP